MAIPATVTLRDIEDNDNSELTVLITASQWKWHYEYLGTDISYYSNIGTPDEQIDNLAPKSEHYLLEVDAPLVLPTDKKIRFLTTADDVIHAWWVPDIAVKQDAIPGFINEAWAEIPVAGIYRGQCAELCGIGHAYMPIVADVRPPRSSMPGSKSRESLLNSPVRLPSQLAPRPGRWRSYCPSAKKFSSSTVRPATNAMAWARAPSTRPSLAARLRQASSRVISTGSCSASPTPRCRPGRRSSVRSRDRRRNHLRTQFLGQRHGATVVQPLTIFESR